MAVLRGCMVGWLSAAVVFVMCLHCYMAACGGLAPRHITAVLLPPTTWLRQMCDANGSVSLCVSQELRDRIEKQNGALEDLRERLDEERERNERLNEQKVYFESQVGI